jgi:CubicO group peptidase (beta-lactamase class C family)
MRVRLLLLLVIFHARCAAAVDDPPVYPAQTWPALTPEQVQLDPQKLKSLEQLAGGRGVIVRHGYLVYAWGDITKSADIASAFKPVLSHLLLIAVQEKRIASPDDKVADFEPRLKSLNDGKDAAITWRHFATQTSGYGLTEKPGQAWSYNDYALALYYDTLTQNVFKTDGDTLLKTYLADELGFEDKYTFNAFGPKDRPGRLALSVRDFARFGLLYLRAGKWRGGDKQLLDPALVKLALSSPVDKNLPLTAGKDAGMLPHQRTIGGTKNITPKGPGQYSFNWWLNLPDKNNNPLFPALPADTFIASGHGGIRQLTVIPKWDLIVSWNDARFKDLDDPALARAFELLRDALLDR